MKYLVLLALILAPFAEAKTVKLTWDDHPDPAVIGFKIYFWQPDAEPTVKDCGMVKPCEVDIEIAKVYSFAATAYADNGLESEFSAIVIYFEMMGTPLQLVSIQGAPAQLRWLEAPPAKGYQVVQGIGSGTNITWNSTNFVAGATNNFAPVTLIQGTNFFKVRPVFESTAEGYPDYTSEFSATKEVAPPNRPVLRLVLPVEQVVQ